jgi:RNA polymerase sigma-70 factor (ECF subfamily)
LSAVVAGDAVAFTDIYSRYFDRIYAYLRVRLGNAHDAEDAAQQVFMQVYRALPRFDSNRSEPLQAWLFAIARNQMITAVRGRRPVEPADPARLQLLRERAGTHEVERRSESIEDPRLLAAVERLPASQRHVIALRYVLGLTIREIATAMDRSPHAVRQLHHRALRALEGRLHQQQATASGSPGTAASSSTVNTSHGVPSGSCTQILSCFA